MLPNLKPIFFVFLACAVLIPIHVCDSIIQVRTFASRDDAHLHKRQRPVNTNGRAFCASLRGRQRLALNNGTQVFTSTCSTVVQGVLPEFNKCVSSIITAPENAASIPQGTNITFSVKTTNLDLGFFDNPNTSYFLSPQTLNRQGIIEGHQHVTMQKIDDPNNPPNVTVVAFFRGLDANEQDTLTTIIPGTATAGNPGLYRICSMSGSRGHQPTLCGRARRGPQDDCIRVTIT